MAPGWALAAVAGGAIFWFWPALAHGLRSDDYLIAYYTDRLAGTVRWDRVAAEFWRPWFDVPDLYRPMVSLSFAVDQAVHGSPRGFHLTNLLIAATTAVATAATAALLAPARPFLALAIAAAIAVLHPAAVEPAAWIVARNTGLQVAAGAVALWLFARHRLRRAPRWPYLLALALALTCKEGAALVPLSFLAFDLLAGPWPFAARLRAHGPAFAVLGGYLALRLCVLGMLGSAGEPPAPDVRLHRLGIGLLHLFAPPDADGARTLVWLAWLGVLPALALARGWRAALLPAWLALLLLPPTHIPMRADALYGRFVFDAVPILTLAVACIAGARPAAGRRPQAAMWLAGAALVVLLAALATHSRHWLHRYDEENATARAAEREVGIHGEAAAPGRPLAIAALPVLPVFHPELWGALGLFPYAARDLPVIGLPELLCRATDQRHAPAAAAALHALLVDGVAATWIAPERRLARLPLPADGSLELAAAAAAPAEFTAGRPWSGLAVAAIEVRLGAAAGAARLRLLDDFPDERALPWLSAHPTAGMAWFDTTGAIAPLLLGSAGVPFRGVRIEVDGGAPPPGTAVIVHGRLPVRGLPRRLDGRELPLAQLTANLPRPAGGGEPVLHLLLPTGVRRAAWPAGRELPAPLGEHAAYAVRAFAPVQVHWFWQGRDPDGRPWRTALDWAIVR